MGWLKMIANEKKGCSAQTAARRGPKPLKKAIFAPILTLDISYKISVSNDRRGIQ